MAGKPVKVTIDARNINSAYLPFMCDETRMQIFFGGSSSGKSRFLAQRCVVDVYNGGRNYLIVRKVAGTIRRSCFNEILKVINDWGLAKDFTVLQQDMLITCNNGYQILFAGLDDVEKLKSITPAKDVLTDVWIEEATETEPGDLKQLEKRLRGFSKFKKRIVLSFNPILQDHWIYSEYFGHWDETKTIYKTETLLILKTTYKDNSFLSDDDVWALENEKDKYWYQVYTLGNWGSLGGVIFLNWRVQDLDEIYKNTHKFCNGLDFGFAKDPAAMVHASYDRSRLTLYIFREVYEIGMTNDLLASAVKNVIGSQTVVCDSSEPKSIQELRNHGVSACPANKGKDSVLFGIQWLQQIQIIIDPRCVRTIAEFRSYRWKEDKLGNTLPEPIDKNNHLIDALRYATEQYQGENPTREHKKVSICTKFNPFRRR